MFSLELIRKKLIVENEHFWNFNKYLEIIFPWDIGPLIIKNKFFLPIIESLLRKMGFPAETGINYDHHHITSITRQVNKNKSS